MNLPRLRGTALGVAVISVTATLACATPAPEMDAIATRCAMAWTSYLALPAGTPVDLELLLLDVDAAGLPPPSFDQARLVGTDAVDVIVTGTADVELARTAQEPYPVSLTIDMMPVGVHEYTRFDYLDEHGVERSLDIGTWRVEILPVSEPALEQTVIQVGGTLFRTVAAEVRNTAPRAVEVTGLGLSLPGVGRTPTMTTGRAPDDTAPLTSAPPQVASASVEIPAGERRFITFDLSVDEKTLSPFVAVQPLIEHRVRGETLDRVLPLGYTRYVPPWDAAAYAAYCASRPASAKHPLGE